MFLSSLSHDSCGGLADILAARNKNGTITTCIVGFDQTRILAIFVIGFRMFATSAKRIAELCHVQSFPQSAEPRYPVKTTLHQYPNKKVVDYFISACVSDNPFLKDAATAQISPFRSSPMLRGLRYGEYCSALSKGQETALQHGKNIEQFNILSDSIN